MARLDPTQPRMPRATREPIVVGNLLAALAVEVCLLLREFGVPLTPGQQNGITAVVGLLILLAAALWARRRTTPLSDPRDALGRPLTVKDEPSERTVE